MTVALFYIFFTLCEGKVMELSIQHLRKFWDCASCIFMANWWIKFGENRLNLQT